VSFTNGAHIKLGGIYAKLDEAAPEEIQRSCYDHTSESLFRRGLDITGVPGAQNLREDRLVQHLTDWSGGEGQVVLRDVQNASSKFFRSEGLDARVAGKLKLNKSTNRITPLDASGGTNATVQGSAYADSTGISTVVNTTDRRLTTSGDVIESTSFSQSSGSTNPIQADFYLYKEPPQTTTIPGSDLLLVSGGGSDSGTDFILHSDSVVRTVNQTSLGTDPYSVLFNLDSQAVGNGPDAAFVRLAIEDVTGNNDEIIASKEFGYGNSGSTTSVALVFTPRSGHTYRYRVRNTGPKGQAKVIVDSLVVGKAPAPTTAVITIRNHDTASVISTQTVSLSNESSALVASVVFNATTAVNYRFRITYTEGVQRPILDKHTTIILSTSAPYIMDAMELGVAGNVVAIAHRSGADPEAWAYNHSTEVWDVYNTALAGVSGLATMQLAHTDLYEYALFSSGLIIQFNGSGDNDYNAAVSGGVGMAICQDRVFLLSIHATNGIDITTYAVDADVSAGVTAVVSTSQVTSASVTADTTLRQRMVGTPYGAYFFVNYSYDSVIYKADASGSTLVTSEVARLDPGAKATSITHVAGLTFVAGQFFAETGETPRSALWVIDQNGVIRRLGYFRREDPTSAIPSFMQPYQSDLWILQGKFMWRYSLQSGGLFLEYQLSPTTESYQRSLAVTQGHTFAMFAQESASQTGGTVWVTGAVGTYRSASVADGNSVTHSIYDYGLPGEDKLLRRVQVVSDELPADTSISIDIQLDQDGTWVPLGSHDMGTETVLTSAVPIVYRSIQVRATLASSTGVSTPELTAVIVDSLPLAREEFFDLILLTEDEDSGFHIGDQMLTGGDIAAQFWGMQKSGTPVTFVDGYENSEASVNPEYLVRIEDARGSNDQLGEGRLSLRLRVL
jgi:hypothetical protein